MIIVGIDPGKATGIAVMDYSDTTHPVLLMHGTPAPEDVTDVLNSHLFTFDPHQITVVIEKFVTREGKHGVDTTPIEVIGRIKEWMKAGGYPFPVVWQLPPEKELVTNDVLRNLGLWLKGKEQRHIMDAARHGVVYLTKKRHKPTMLKGWPPSE